MGRGNGRGAKIKEDEDEDGEAGEPAKFVNPDRRKCHTGRNSRRRDKVTIPQKTAENTEFSPERHMTSGHLGLALRVP